MSTLLEVRNLVKTYPPPRGKKDVIRAVDGVSFSIPAGECFGLLGPNGAGKSTTIEVCEDVLRATSGEVLFKGSPRDRTFRERVGIQFQNTELPGHQSVRETLEFFGNLYDRRLPLESLIELCRLEEILDRDSHRISGGQKQRLLLAMALANDPELVFLDEPTTGLDPQARRHLWDIVERIKGLGKTIILTTHYMEEAQILCDRVAIMDHGRIIAEGTPARLLSEHCSGASVILRESSRTPALEGLPWDIFETQEGVEILTDDVSETVRALLERRVDLAAMTVRSRNLEDLFLKLTGKELRA